MGDNGASVLHSVGDEEDVIRLPQRDAGEGKEVVFMCIVPGIMYFCIVQ